MKKKIFVLAAVVVCIAIAATGTLAYFTTSDTARNVITSGTIDIDVVERMVIIDENGKETETEFPAEGIQGVMPGTAVSKVVQVENTGTGKAWIRVSVEAAIVSASGEALPTDVMTFEVLEGWTEKDGYYYYNEPVATGEVTGELFTEVNFAPSMGNEYQNCTANIVINAEAVQVANNAETVLEAQGWPN